jgi:hypothetical protein
MIGIDWVAVAIIAAAWVFSKVTPFSLAVKNVVFALACFAIVGLRLRSGSAGNNLLFVAIAAALGVSYVVAAIKARKR